MTVLARRPSSRWGQWSGQGLRPRLPFPLGQGASRGRVLLSWRTFTVSRPLQPGMRLLRRLRPPAHTLAWSRPAAAGPMSWEFPSSDTKDVIVTGSCLLYAGWIRDHTERCVRPLRPPPSLLGRVSQPLSPVHYDDAYTGSCSSAEVTGLVGQPPCGSPLPNCCPQASDPGGCQPPTPAAWSLYRCPSTAPQEQSLVPLKGARHTY
jgi:hypothetical protein